MTKIYDDETEDWLHELELAYLYDASFDANKAAKHAHRDAQPHFEIGNELGAEPYCMVRGRLLRRWERQFLAAAAYCQDYASLETIPAQEVPAFGLLGRYGIVIHEGNAPVQSIPVTNTPLRGTTIAQLVERQAQQAVERRRAELVDQDEFDEPEPDSTLERFWRDPIGFIRWAYAEVADTIAAPHQFQLDVLRSIIDAIERDEARERSQKQWRDQIRALDPPALPSDEDSPFVWTLRIEVGEAPVADGFDLVSADGLTAHEVLRWMTRVAGSFPEDFALKITNAPSIVAIRNVQGYQKED